MLFIFNIANYIAMFIHKVLLLLLQHFVLVLLTSLVIS